MKEPERILSALPPKYLSDVRNYQLGKARASSVVVKKARQVIPAGNVSVECKSEVINE